MGQERGVPQGEEEALELLSPLHFSSLGSQGSPGHCPLLCPGTMGLCSAPFEVTFPPRPASQRKLAL